MESETAFYKKDSGKLTVFGSDGGSRWDWFCGGKKVGELCGSLAKYLFEAWWDERGIRWD